MAYISYDKFGRSELYHNTSGKDKLQNKISDKFNLPLHDLTEHLKETQNKINFTEKEEINLNEIEKLKNANDIVETFLKAIVLSSTVLQLEYNNFIKQFS